VPSGDWRARCHVRSGRGRLDLSRFPAAHGAALADALAYLVQSPTLRAVLRRLAGGGHVVYLEYHAAHTKMLHHNAANLRIQWNPHLGLIDATGWLSPALLLAHELGHAQFTIAERAAMLACTRPQGFANEPYGVEEACVIATVEQPVAAEVNAARRRAGLVPLETAERCQRQFGRLIEVAGPLSACPAAPSLALSRA
jgi:hypothetical protein